MSIAIASITMFGAVYWANSIHLRDDKSKMRVSVRDLSNLTRYGQRIPRC